ncbi:glycosyltransferase family 2 protein [Photobacterium sp. J15]|uniref:glycosyltransferase family 2 protein n=1 Tax=Photobacterium sp. J15 TaxID=265901 RepID=UPI0007E468AF|nr:glycosyltransferase family 2 protein [Photobacterium sp. J15]
MSTGVSIITATFNSAAYIRETYESICNQTYTDWEWLVTDDCSTDDTLKVLNEIAANDQRVYVFKNPVNSGAAISRNVSLSNAKKEYIAFIDSDDLWDRRKLELQLKFMGDSGSFSFTAYRLVDEKGLPLEKTVDSTNVGSFSYEDMLRKKATIGCSTVILRSSSFVDISMPLIRTGQDYALWLKLLKTGTNATLYSDVLTSYRITPGSISRNKIKKAMRQWQIYRGIECLPLAKSLECFCFYAWRAVFKR